VGVARDGQPVLSHAYGLAHVEHDEPVQTSSLFRIASVSKPLTILAIVRLVDEGRLSLDTRVFPLLDDLPPPANARPDRRMGCITVQNLLRHGRGWNSRTSYDRQAVPWTYTAAAACWASRPRLRLGASYEASHPTSPPAGPPPARTSATTCSGDD
jgi:CubicO group peptidase (beta-lactamase class C family)